MGRDYFGSINGQFWSAIQHTNAADRFGVTGVEQSALYYYFDKGNLADVEAELKVIKKQLGPYRAKLTEFFKEDGAYLVMPIGNYLELPKDKVHKLIRLYADYELGMKIRECILVNGCCEFTAEY